MSPDQLPPSLQLMQMAAGKLVARPIYVAAKLGLADLIATGPKSADELAAATKCHARSLYRLLRALASVGIFAEGADKRFTLTPMAEALRSGPESKRAMATMFGSPFHELAWNEFEYSIRTGKSAFEKVHGMGMFTYLQQHPADNAVFNDAMTNLASTNHRAVAEAYDFSGITRLIDIGGGHGAMLAAILARNPKLRGAVFDLPHVVSGAPATFARLGCADRAEALGGDFFASVPAADAHIMSHIIHDWDDERCGQLLRNVRKATTPKGRLLVVEMVVADGNEPSFAKLLDLEMLALPGGQERTADEFKALFAANGFRLERIVPTKSPLSVIEGVAV